MGVVSKEAIEDAFTENFPLHRHIIEVEALRTTNERRHCILNIVCYLINIDFSVTYLYSIRFQQGNSVIYPSELNNTHLYQSS